MKKICILLMLSVILPLCLGACDFSTPKQPPDTTPLSKNTEAHTQDTSIPKPDHSAYDLLIDKYTTAISEKWDISKLYDEDLCPLIFLEIATEGEGGLGYAFLDVDHDNIDELIIGTRYDNSSPVILDMYTVIEGIPKRILLGTERQAYYISRQGDKSLKIVYNGASSAFESESILYSLKNGELIPELSVKYSEDSSHSDPWYIGEGKNGTLTYSKAEKESALALEEQICSGYIRPEYKTFK